METHRMKRYQDFVKRTAAGDEFRKNCDRTADYYKFWELQTSKQKDWSRPEYYQSRIDKQQETEERKQKETSLNARRQKLSTLLFEENMAYNEELARMLDWSEKDDSQLKKKYQDLVARKKEHRKLNASRPAQFTLLLEKSIDQVQKHSQLEIEQMSRPSTAQIPASEDTKMAEKQDALLLQELRATIDREDLEKEKRDEQQRLVNINIEDALQKLRENESVIAALVSQEAMVSKMEQELFCIDQDNIQMEKQRALDEKPTKFDRQVVFQLRKKATQVLNELEQDKNILQRIQIASEQTSLTDPVQKKLYLQVNNLLLKISEQSVREKRVANHNANIFHEDALNEMKACEQRWSKERSERKLRLAQVLDEWQKHARGRREEVVREKQQLETECKALIELTRMQREAGKAMADLKSSIVQKIVEQDEGKSSAEM